MTYTYMSYIRYDDIVEAQFSGSSDSKTKVQGALNSAKALRSPSCATPAEISQNSPCRPSNSSLAATLQRRPCNVSPRPSILARTLLQNTLYIILFYTILYCIILYYIISYYIISYYIISYYIVLYYIILYYIILYYIILYYIILYYIILYILYYIILYYSIL